MGYGHSVEFGLGAFSLVHFYGFVRAGTGTGFLNMGFSLSVYNLQYMSSRPTFLSLSRISLAFFRSISGEVLRWDFRTRFKPEYGFSNMLGLAQSVMAGFNL